MQTSTLCRTLFVLSKQDASVAIIFTMQENMERIRFHRDITIMFEFWVSSNRGPYSRIREKYNP